MKPIIENPKFYMFIVCSIKKANSVQKKVVKTNASRLGVRKLVSTDICISY